jgi:Flp pilus assembly protein TadD
VLALGACGRPAPKGPATAVRADIEQAEDAEKARRHDLARDRYLHAIADATDPASEAFARHEYAETLVTWGEVGEAIVQLEQVVHLHPSDAAAWHDLGFLRFHEGHPDAAIEALERSKALAPHDVRPRKTLAVIRWKTGDLAGAKAEYRAMLDLDLPATLRSQVEWAIAELDRRPL